MPKKKRSSSSSKSKSRSRSSKSQKPKPSAAATTTNDGETPKEPQPKITKHLFKVSEYGTKDQSRPFFSRRGLYFIFFLFLCVIAVGSYALFKYLENQAEIDGLIKDTLDKVSNTEKKDDGIIRNSDGSFTKKSKIGAAVAAVAFVVIVVASFFLSGAQSKIPPAIPPRPTPKPTATPPLPSRPQKQTPAPTQTQADKDKAELLAALSTVGKNVTKSPLFQDLHKPGESYIKRSGHAFRLLNTAKNKAAKHVRDLEIQMTAGSNIKINNRDLKPGETTTVNHDQFMAF